MKRILDADPRRLIDERSAAFPAAVAAASSTEVQVPTRAEWMLFALMTNLDVGRRSWAATFAAGSASTEWSSWTGEPPVPSERVAVLAWSADATRELGTRSGKLHRTADAGNREGRRGRRRPDVPSPGTRYRKALSSTMTRSSLALTRKRFRRR